MTLQTKCTAFNSVHKNLTEINKHYDFCNVKYALKWSIMVVNIMAVLVLYDELPPATNQARFVL